MPGLVLSPTAGRTLLRTAPAPEVRLPVLRHLCPEDAMAVALAAWQLTESHLRRNRSPRNIRKEVRAARRYHALRRILGA